MPIVTLLSTPPVRQIVPAAVFDAFAWTASDKLEWRRPEGVFDVETAIDGSDPARMVFVLREDCAFLPTELARLHAFGLGLKEEHALAPYAIDDASDELYARKAAPGSWMWLAADNLNALFWGLHDWAHFHNHGPFTQRAWTELQCDAAALFWLSHNRERIGLPSEILARVELAVHRLTRERFAREGLGVPPRLATSELAS